MSNPNIQNHLSQGNLQQGLHSNFLHLALDEIVAKAGGDGGVIVRTRERSSLALVSSTLLNNAVAEYVRGDRPADSRASRVNPELNEGFRLDYDDFTPHQIAHDPYYQEFLRGHGLRWHACAKLGVLANGDALFFSIKRCIDRGPFQADDMHLLAPQLKMLRTSLAFSEIFPSRPSSGLDEAGVAQTALVALSPDGSAIALRSALGQERLFSIRNGKIMLVQPASVSRFRRAVETAMAGIAAPNLLLIDGDERRWIMNVTLAQHAAFAHHSALMTFRCIDFVEEASNAWQQAMRETFDLTQAEAKVADFLRQGATLKGIAGHLALAEGTVRNHLKAIFGKTGARRQAELAVLFSRL